MAVTQGAPCWYGLGTTDLDAASTFYEQVLGWSVTDSGMPDMDYRLAQIDGDMVAGMMSTARMEGAPPPNWLVYFAVDSADDIVGTVQSRGGSIVIPPTDIPGTGRFGVLTDPQGAFFGVLQPEPMDTEPQGGAFDQSKPGHGNWHELMVPDPAAAFDFYAGLFGWTKDQALDMGDMGTYQLFAHEGTTIGGMMGQGNSPVPTWLPYFGSGGTDAAIERVKAAGGNVMHGPMEVPGGGWIAIAQDPQGAVFAFVGPKEQSA